MSTSALNQASFPDLALVWDCSASSRVFLCFSNLTWMGLLWDQKSYATMRFREVIRFHARIRDSIRMHLRNSLLRRYSHRSHPKLRRLGRVSHVTFYGLRSVSLLKHGGVILITRLSFWWYGSVPVNTTRSTFLSRPFGATSHFLLIQAEVSHTVSLSTVVTGYAVPFTALFNASSKLIELHCLVTGLPRHAA